MKYLITSLVLFTISVWVVAIYPSPLPGSAETVASMWDNVYESITLKLGDGCTVDEIAREYNANKSFYDSMTDDRVKY